MGLKGTPLEQARDADEDRERMTGSHVDPDEAIVVALERLDLAAEKWPAGCWPHMSTNGKRTA